MKDELIYLAIPYTWNPHESYRIANEISAELISKGKVVFSPISHSHSIANHMSEELRTDFETWMRQDIPILRKCDKAIIVVIGEGGERLIRESKGCQRELKEIKSLGINLERYEYKRESVAV